MLLPRSRFRPCIDLHDGRVKQIKALKTNFVQSAGDFARLYRDNGLLGGHVIKLGPGNDDAARDALSSWPGGLQIGGGINDTNAQQWLDAGGEQTLSARVGKENLVVDVSCRKRGDGWFVAMNKWQDITDMEVSQDVEGLCQGIDEALVSKLGEWARIPCTYAGGAKAIDDLSLVDRLSGGRVDLTYGSALDIFGGSLVIFEELVKLNTN
ncbi:hypothetical protein C8J57DRAFT_1432702 [Mycena rebaudengoi]|nr:hypothetical protein C8J57DRAFT_1432702 [Mycena rebaudengoi]